MSAATRPRPLQIDPPDEEEDSRLVVNGRMKGAQDLRPDKERPLEDVLKDYAVRAWGDLRSINQLDSHKAEQILAEHLGRFLLSLRDDGGEHQRKVNRLIDAGRKLRDVVMKLWGEAPKKGEPGSELSNGPLKLCRLCKKPKGAHKVHCPVKTALSAATDAGITR